MTQGSETRFPDEAVIREYLEAIRWPDGPVCPHCGTVDHAFRLTGERGVYRCGRNDCRKNFNVKSGTLFEWSRIPLNKWLLATHLILSHQEGISPRQLGHILGFNYWTALSLARRIREALLPLPKRRRVLNKEAIWCLLNTPPKHSTRRRASGKKKAQRKRRGSGRSARLTGH